MAEISWVLASEAKEAEQSPSDKAAAATARRTRPDRRNASSLAGRLGMEFASLY